MSDALPVKRTRFEFAEAEPERRKRLGRIASPNTRTWFHEAELDEIWHNLSIEKKWSVLAPVMGQGEVG